MNNAKEIKVHDTVWVNLKPIFGTDDDNLAGYAKVLHIEENKNEGVTYYDVCFRGSGAVFYGVDDYYVHPITSTEAVLPKVPKDNGTTRTDKGEWVMTNYGAVKAMGMNELAGFLASITTCCGCPAYGNCGGPAYGNRDVHEVCTASLLEWLADLLLGKEINVDDEPGETSDMIHHPDHYTWKGTECKTIIESMTKGLDGQDAYYVGNIIKYLYRYPAKGTAIKDLMKARQYLDFLITTEEVKEKKREKDK